jgi:BioD-like phosphotransacetylase family protein
MEVNMKRLYIGSMNRYSGKTIVTLGFSLVLKEKGFKVGYIKPLGKDPLISDGEVVDANAFFFKTVLDLDEPISMLSPFVLTMDMLNTTLAGKMKNMSERILKAIKLIKNKDIVLIAGTTDLFEGSVFGLSGTRIVKATDARALIIEVWEDEETLDDLFGAKEILGDRLIGVILNKVREESTEFIRKKIRPYLRRHQIEVFGMLPQDSVLGAVTVKNLAEILGGKVLCAEDRLDELVENFSIGAMDVHNALKYFKVTLNKAVITGAHRSDIQLAALDTSTKCIILTGGLLPNDVIIGKARLKGVPVISVKDDTFSTVDRIEKIIGKFKIREQEKLERVIKLVRNNVDVQGILKKTGVKKSS